MIAVLVLLSNAKKGVPEEALTVYPVSGSAAGGSSFPIVFKRELFV